MSSRPASGGNADVEAGPASNSKEEKHPVRHGLLPVGQRVMRLTWSWFPCTMSTGAMSSLFSQQPFKFDGIVTIGKIFFIVDLVLFVLFTAMIIARFCMKPNAITRSLHHPTESFFFGAFWVSVALILYGMQVYGVPSCGPWLVKAMEVLFWMYVALETLVAIFQYHVIFDVENLLVSEAMPAWILPAYPYLVTGPLASAIAKTQPPGSALRILIAGITCQGAGWAIAFIIYTIFLTRLMNSNMPAPSSKPGMYISVGPTGYTAAALVTLGTQAQKVVPPNYLSITSVPTGDIWKAFSVPCAIFLWLIAFWFCGLTTVSILRTVRHMSFSLQWWAFIFPNAGLAIATIQIGNALDSDGIRGVGSALTVILVALWLMVAGAHLKAVWSHQVLSPGKDEGVDDVNNHTHNHSHPGHHDHHVNEKQRED
ncbi:malic acid transport protein [Lineolata rhizophorae]|uniref:Malic acid transport protein n=1 Tax=Lineolata rhizophorae TaxID=578093 RepID=A0A6A6NN69_9PEZI|nr:malic acid transport protein [Lineolata rhizophorae]